MTDDEARAVIADALGEIAPEVSLDDLEPDERFADGLDLDSMDFLNLLVGVHERTGIEIPERDYAAVDTLDGFVAYLVARST